MPLRGLIMNANELANEIESLGDEIGLRFTQKIATTLRQQAQEIEELKAEKLIHDESYLIQMREIIKLKEKLEGAESIIKMWTPIINNRSMINHIKERI